MSYPGHRFFYGSYLSAGVQREYCKPHPQSRWSKRQLRIAKQNPFRKNGKNFEYCEFWQNLNWQITWKIHVSKFSELMGIALGLFYNLLHLSIIATRTERIRSEISHRRSCLRKEQSLNRKYFTKRKPARISAKVWSKLTPPKAKETALSIKI